MATGYQPRNSNYHDHLCDCPGCNPGDPDPTDEEVAVWTWQELQAVPLYIERYAQDDRWVPVIPVDFIIHDDATPFCDDARCDCHNLALNGQTFIECIEQPIRDGLLTTAEGLRLYWGEQI